MPSRPREYPVPALEKGLDVLEALAVSSGPLTLAELAERLHRTRNELFRMLSCLEARGYVQRDAAGANRLTLKLFELAHRHPPIDMLLRIADRPMQEIALAIEQSVHISVISRGRLVVLAQADSPRKVRIAVEVGGSFPVIETISGPPAPRPVPRARAAALPRSRPGVWRAHQAGTLDPAATARAAASRWPWYGR